MSEDSGKRGLRAFVDWVENGPDWEDEAGVHEGGAGGHGGEAGGHGEADTVHASEQAVKRNTKRTMGRRFAEFTEEHALRVFGRVYRAVAQIVCLAGMAVLLMMVTHLPAFGSADNPANNEVVGRYLENGLSETGAVNTVAGIILDYRAFDTFGESVVLFLAAVSVIALLHRKSESGYSGREDQRGERSMKRMRKEISYWNRWPGCWFPLFLCLASMWCSTAICPPEAGSQEER